MADMPAPVAAFLAAIADRDIEAVGRTFTDDIVYHFIVPHPPAEGRDAVLEALRGSIEPANRVEWQVVSWLADSDRAFVERIDRFWFGDREAAIECTGVFELRDGKIAEIRDYADLGTWRARKSAAIDA